MSKHRAEIRNYELDADGTVRGKCYNDTLGIYFDGETIEVVGKAITKTDLNGEVLTIETASNIYRCVDRRAN